MTVQLPSGSIGTSSISTPFCRMTILSTELAYDSSPANNRSTQVLRRRTRVSDCGVDGPAGASATMSGAGRPANSCPQNAGSGETNPASPSPSRVVTMRSSLAIQEIEDGFARGLDDLHHLFDLRGADLQLFQSFPEDRGYPVEMPRFQPHFADQLAALCWDGPPNAIATKGFDFGRPRPVSTA